MSKRWTYWCPNGCGKKVVYWGIFIGYKCQDCEKIFTKEEIEEE